MTTFYTSMEPWLRPIKEEDIGFLEYAGEEVEPFVMPKLGRHYTEVWENEDVKAYGCPLPATAAMRANAPRHPAIPPGPLPRWEPSTLSDNDAVVEERGHGPLTERLVTALIPNPATEWKGVKAAEEAMEGRPGTNGAAAAAARDKLNVADLEDRVTNVLRFHGILDEPVSSCSLIAADLPLTNHARAFSLSAARLFQPSRRSDSYSVTTRSTRVADGARHQQDPPEPSCRHRARPARLPGVRGPARHDRQEYMVALYPATEEGQPEVEEQEEARLRTERRLKRPATHRH